MCTHRLERELMISDLKPYPEMKGTSIHWLGELPAGWSVRRNGSLFVQRNETGFVDLPILEVSLKTGVRVRDFGGSSRKQIMDDRAKYKRASCGDLAYNMMRMWQGAVGVAPVDGLVSPAYVVARPLPGVLPNYFAYLFRTDAYMGEVDNYSRGIVKDRNRLYWEQFKQIQTPCPPTAEQAAIVRFLDHADRKICRYIRAKQKLIKLLEEQKQAIIHLAVTRGLDPNMRLKPSGVEWLGDVPEHWEVKRLKWVTRLQRGYDLPAEVRIAGPFPVVSSGGFIDTHCEARAPAPGVVIGRYGSTDAVFFIETDFWPHNTALFVTDFQGNHPRWCYFMLRTISKAEQAGKSAVPGVDRKDLFDIKVVRPACEEQIQIIDWIESETAQLEVAVSAAQHEITLLHEFRTRLIADVITGKLDVREAAAQLPDEVEELHQLEETDDIRDNEDDALDDLDEALEDAVA